MAFVMVEARELIALQASCSVAGDACGTIAPGGGMQQHGDALPYLRKRDRWRRLFSPDGFPC